ncbi:MAG: HEAT repeat domain-containing protein [Deltaproteobacteria bacterium]|nr:HEAT repeat domain-containing protein [Deltaproteobacteria bacterium]
MILLLAFFLFPAVLRADSTIKYFYQAVRIPSDAGSSLMLMPQGLNVDKGLKQEEVVKSVFKKLREKSPSEYGKTELRVEGDLSVNRRVDILLDPEKKGDWDLVLGETYHSLRSLGVNDVRAPLLQPQPLDASCSSIPVFLVVIPYYQALPPEKFNHALIALNPVTFLPSQAFYLRIETGNKEILDSILEGLNGKDNRIKLAVLSAVPHLPVKNIQPLLLPLLSDPSSAVKLAVLEIVKNDSSKIVTDKIEAVVESDADPTVKLSAVKILSKHGIRKYDIFILMDDLKSPDDGVVVAALDKLAASGNPKVASALFTALFHKNPSVREKGMNGIIQLKDSAVMVQSMEDERVSMDIREKFARELLKLNGSQAEKGLSFLINTAGADGATHAIKYMGEKKNSNYLNTLYLSLKREEAAVRHEALKVIGEVGNESSLKVLTTAASRKEDSAQAEQAALKIISAQTFDFVLKLFDSHELMLRKLAMKALADFIKGGQTISPKVVAALEGRLNDPDIEVRKAAVYTLARLKDPKITAKLLALAGDSSPEIREQAVVAASGSTEPRADEIILNALQDEADNVKKAGVIAARERGIKKALDVLFQMDKYRDDGIRREVILAIRTLLSKEDIGKNMDFFIDKLFDADEQIRLCALDALSGLKEIKVFSTVSEMIKDKSKNVRLKSLALIAGDKYPDAVEIIFRIIMLDDDKEVRAAALKALGALGDQKALDPLQEFLNQETDTELKKVAAEALQELVNKN